MDDAARVTIKLAGGKSVDVLRYNVNPVIRRNTDHIMDMEMITQTFASLRQTPKQPLSAIEKSVSALAQSVGFGSLQELVAHVSKAPQRNIIIRDDDEVLFDTKLRSLTMLLNRRSDNAMLRDWQKDSDTPQETKIGSLLRMIREDVHNPSIEPMAATPLPAMPKKRAGKLPKPYNQQDMLQRFEKVTALGHDVDRIVNEQEKVKAKASHAKLMEELETDMIAMAKDAVAYWEAVFVAFERIKTDEIALRQEIDFIISSQMTEADRVTAEIIDYITSIEGSLSIIPILIAESYSLKDDNPELSSTIADTINEKFHRITFSPSSFDKLSELLLLPKNKSSVTRWIADLFPMPMRTRSDGQDGGDSKYQQLRLLQDFADGVSAMSRGDQLSVTLAAMIYFAL